MNRWTLLLALCAAISVNGEIAAAQTPVAGTNIGAGCTVTPPPGIDPGTVTWLGPCHGGKAEGVGVLRVQRDFDWSLFLGRAVGGRPVAGALFLRPAALLAMVRVDPAGNPISGETNAANAAVFQLAAKAAEDVAMRFAAQGNLRSRDFYRRMTATLRTANAATGYPAGTLAAHAAALADLRAGLRGGATLDGHTILAVLPSGHCGTVIDWAGGSFRIDWQVQGNEAFVAEGGTKRFAINTNTRGMIMLRYPKAASARLEKGVGALMWACAPE